MSALLQAWDSRTPRERVLLAVMAVAVVAVVGFYGVIMPLKHGVEDARERVVVARQQADALAMASRQSAPRAADGRPVSAIVEASPASLGAPIARKRQEADGAFTIWITAADARALLTWIAGLERSSGLSVVGVTTSRLDNGLVEAEVTFGKGAA